MKKHFFKTVLAVGLAGIMALSISYTAFAGVSTESPTIARTRAWDAIEHTLGGIPESVRKIEYEGCIFYLGAGVTNEDFLKVLAAGAEAVWMHTDKDKLYSHPAYILWNTDKTVLLVHPIIYEYDNILEAVSIPAELPESLTGTETQEKTIFFEKVTLLNNDELTDLAKTAPNHLETRSARKFTNQALTDTEFAAWVDEYLELGGISAFELEVVRLINEERAKHGLKPLSIMPHYMQAARFRSQEMYDLGYTSHTSPVYGSAGAIIRRLGVNLSGSENIAPGGTPEAVVNAWLTSTKGHRESLLSPTAGAIGVGHVGNGDGGRTTALLISESNLRAYLEGRMK